ncbi:hypothetical protein GQ457_07G005460 [Hibiscus cannabinus]
MTPTKGENDDAVKVVAGTQAKEPTLESRLANLETPVKDAFEKLDVIDDHLDELENKGDELKEDVNTAINKAFEGMEK